MMHCDDIQNKMLDLIKGKIEEADEYRLKAHMQTCEQCREYFADLQEMMQDLKSIPLEEPSPRMKMQFYSMLQQYEESTLVQPNSDTAPRQFWRTLVAAASIGVMLVSSYWLTQNINQDAQNKSISLQQETKKDTKQQEKQQEKQDITINPEKNTAQNNSTIITNTNESKEPPILSNITTEKQDIVLDAEMEEEKQENYLEQNKDKEQQQAKKEINTTDIVTSSTANFNNSNTGVSMDRKVRKDTQEQQAGSLPAADKKLNIVNQFLSKYALQATEKDLESLLNMLNKEENPNVKVAVMEVLSQEKYALRPEIQEKVLQTLEFQQSPSVQMLILDFALQYEKGKNWHYVELFLQKNDLDKSVREYAQEIIQLKKNTKF